MTYPDYTAIAILMDRSGSMERIRSDAEGAIRAFIDDQKDLPGRCTVRLSEFDDSYSVVYPSTPVTEVPDYTLTPRGMTALFDGIGRLVVEFGEELAAAPEPERPGRVIVVVQTDGLENSSKEWDRARVFEAITRQRDEYGWDFVFLGANQDAIATGTGLGFDAGSSLTYAASRAGAAAAGLSMSSYVSRYRRGAAAAFTPQDRERAVES